MHGGSRDDDQPEWCSMSLVSAPPVENVDPVRILTVDDHAIFHAAARELIDATPGFVWVGAASSGEQALELVATSEPDLVLMDVRMPGIGGVEATRRIGAEAPGTVVVLVTADELGVPAPPEAAAVVRKSALRRALLSSLWEHHRPAARS
jgi:CheY-like chemotaxis protein